MPKIISVHSYRGGTGKSNTTANIAAITARNGYRVGVIDTDLPSPGIHVIFGLQEDRVTKSINDFLWGRCRMAEAAYDMTAILQDQAKENSKIYLVPASVKINDISRVLREGFDSELLFEGFKQLIKDLKLDYLFIDTHPGLNEETLLSLTVSDVVLLILRPDQQDFQGTAVTVDVARRLQVPNLYLLVNKALTDYSFEQVSKQVEKTYNVPVVGVLPESTDLIRLASRGLLSIRYPNHAISLSLSKMTERILA